MLDPKAVTRWRRHIYERAGMGCYPKQGHKAGTALVGPQTDRELAQGVEPALLEWLKSAPPE
jgi:hypothetical protein